MNYPSGATVPVVLIIIGAAILLPTLTLYSACGILAQFIAVNCLAALGLSFYLGIAFIIGGVVLWVLD